MDMRISSRKCPIALHARPAKQVPTNYYIKQNPGLEANILYKDIPCPQPEGRFAKRAWGKFLRKFGMARP